MRTIHLSCERPRALFVSLVAAATVTFLAAGMAPANADGLEPQTIDFASLQDANVGEYNELSATASSGLAVSFTTSSGCRLDDAGGVPAVVAVTAGTCSVTAHQAGDTHWAPAPDVTQSFDFLPSESMTGVYADGGWVHAPGKPVTVLIVVKGEYGDVPAPSGIVNAFLLGDVPADMKELGAIHLDAEGHGSVTLSGDQTKRLDKGHYGLSGTYEGDANYARSFSEFNPLELFTPTTVTASVAPKHITHGEKVTFTAHVEAASGPDGPPLTGEIEIRWSELEGVADDVDEHGNVTVSTNELPGGTVQLVAQYLPDNEEYGTSWQKLTVTVDREAQRISFPAPPDRRINQVFTPDATASSGLDVAFVTLTPKVCDVDWDEDYDFFVTALKAGTCTLRAEQTGNESYLPAADVIRSFTVLPYPSPTPSPSGGGAAADAGPLGGAPQGVALVSATTPTQGRTVRLDKPVTLVYGSAPVAVAKVGESVRISARGLPAGSTNLVRIRMGGRWVSLGRVVADSTGTVDLPALEMRKAGTYALRIVPAGKAPRYLSLHVTRVKAAKV